jgi:hypothetical protein
MACKIQVELYAVSRARSGTGWIFLTTLAGEPIATENGGMSLVTTLPAPIVHPFPIVIPGIITVFPPIQQSFPIVTSLAYSTPSRRDWISVSWVAAKMLTPGPNNTLSPIWTIPQSSTVKLHIVSDELPLHFEDLNTLEVCVDIRTNGYIASIINPERRVNE